MNERTRVAINAFSIIATVRRVDKVKLSACLEGEGPETLDKVAGRVSSYHAQNRKEEELAHSYVRIPEGHPLKGRH